MKLFALSVALFAATLVGTVNDGQSFASEPVVAVQTVAQPVMRLQIPAISVDVSVEPVGLTPSGAMDAPKGPQGAGWYSSGPRPGARGSAVIDGHSGWKNNIRASFDRVDELKVGDRIYVTDGSAATIPFIVREVRAYSEGADASRVFSSTDGKARLNLITCEGIWNAGSHSYSARRVVFAEKE